MDIKNIKEIAKLMKENNLTLIDIKEGETNLHIERKLPENCIKASETANTPAYDTSASNANNKNKNANDINAEKEHTLPLEKAVDFNKIIEVKSPMVGVFYTMPAPDKEPFVKIGSHVKKGDILCIIEAMKLFNEIVAENDGEIVDICAVNGQVVEYSQVLFKIF